MSGRAAYVMVAVLTTAIFLLVLAIVADESTPLWVLIAFVLVMIVFPRHWLARRLSRATRSHS